MPDSEYSGDKEMFDKIHEMRTRIMMSSKFDCDRLMGTILFEQTTDREIDGKPTAQYLWQTKRIVSLLKVDKGLEEEKDGVQLMKPIPGLEPLLPHALELDVFGTKMRSVVKTANSVGVKRLVEQQFEVAGQILDAGLVPMIEPVIDIHSPEKKEAEVMLRASLVEHLGRLAPDRKVMLKLTLPEVDDYYLNECVRNPNVLRVVALSGGYSCKEASERLSRQAGGVASFSRALTEGLNAQQEDDAFDENLDGSIESIFQASKA